MTEVPFEKFDVAPVMPLSRCQSWKFQVSPPMVPTKPVGLGICWRSMARETVSVAPLFWIWPGPT